MPRRRLNVPMACLVLAGARILAWLTDVAGILAMGYIVKCWPENGASVSAGLVGALIALLNDSWEAIAYLDPTDNFLPLTAPRTVLHDLFSMGVCMGGLILLLFTDIREQRDENGQVTHSSDYDDKRLLLSTAQWLLAAIAALRFVFAVWSGCNCAALANPRSSRLRNRDYRGNWDEITDQRNQRNQRNQRDQGNRENRENRESRVNQESRESRDNRVR